MIKIGIIGGAGYTAGELLRILLLHPHAEIVAVQSTSHKGEPIAHVHKDLLGETEMYFSTVIFDEIDVLFLCSGHGRSLQYLEEHHLPESLKVIDLSTDYRPKNNTKGFLYGLPELNKSAIKNAKRIANPGCFATCIELALLPLANAQQLKNEVHVHAITGSTGAGQQATATTHFSWKNNNVAIYKAFSHQHLAEITESVKQLQIDFDQEINFIPVRGNFSRGILASIYTHCDLELDEAIEAYKTFYKDHPFVSIAKHQVDVKQVLNSNKCFLQIEKHDSKILITSVIDNLLKGASGQAVQNMNLLFDLPETEGLKLKTVGF